MRKSELLKLYENAFNEIHKLSFELEKLESENSKLNARITELTSENESLKARETDTKSLISLKNKMVHSSLTSPATEYGAHSIGKIVISAAKHCNALTDSAEGVAKKELVNLILGRTEVAKAEILKIVECDCEIGNKKEMIDSEEKSAEDYFVSIRAQI